MWGSEGDTRVLIYVTHVVENWWQNVHCVTDNLFISIQGLNLIDRNENRLLCILKVYVQKKSS
jgi:hypothetical protein